MRNDDWFSSAGYFNGSIPQSSPVYPVFPERVPGEVYKKIQVDKTTHRIRFENETESQVTIVIEPKETA